MVNKQRHAPLLPGAFAWEGRNHMATQMAEREDTRVEEAEAATRPASAAAEHATAAQMFQFSTYLHVGPGAEGCEDFASCADPLHFHAWCRLPNKFQHKDI